MFADSANSVPMQVTPPSAVNGNAACTANLLPGNQSQVARSAVDKNQSQAARSAVDKNQSQAARSAIDNDKSRESGTAVGIGADETDCQQLDLFINTPFDQALHACRRALQNDQLDLAAGHYQAALALRAEQSANAPSGEVLHDAQACLALLQDGHHESNALAVWARCKSEGAALQRFFGAGSEAMVRRVLRLLAARSALESFDSAHPDAYAAHIWLELDEPELAHAVLSRDTDALDCPHRRLLWAQVTWELANRSARGVSTSPQDAPAVPRVALIEDSFRHWQALCLRWPENAEIALSTEARFALVWDEFCELDPPQPMAAFPGFACLHRVPWPQPDTMDGSPCASLLRVAHALNAERDSVPQRLALKALNLVVFEDWMARRALV